MLKRFTILALVGFAIMPQLSHGFTFPGGNSYYQKANVLDTGLPPAEQAQYGLDYSRTCTEPFSLSARPTGPWLGVNSSLSGLTIEPSHRGEQYPTEPVPEPATLILVGLGLVETGTYRRYFRRSKLERGGVFTSRPSFPAGRRLHFQSRRDRLDGKGNEPVTIEWRSPSGGQTDQRWRVRSTGMNLIFKKNSAGLRGRIRLARAYYI